MNFVALTEASNDVSSIRSRMKIGNVEMYIADLTPTMARLTVSLNEVAFIEPDHEMKTNGVQMDTTSWGLTRITERENNEFLMKYMYPDSAGRGVTVYVIDNGVLCKHPGFEGRANCQADFIKEEPKNVEHSGHATHVAGIVASEEHGVAKKANIVSIKVANGNGDSDVSHVIAGIDWAVKHAKYKSPDKGVKGIINVSMGGAPSRVLDLAVEVAISEGLVVVVAAGNDGQDACSFSPSRVQSAITVAASNIQDQLAHFDKGGSSNYGKCVDIVAPGNDIVSLWDHGTDMKTGGTSQAAPHVSGIVALALSEMSFSRPQEVKNYILSIATVGKLQGDLRETPNLLAYSQIIKTRTSHPH